jgi:sugar phosphate isomerase/epimerase
MSRAFSLAYLTLAPFGPVEAIDLAADFGAAHVGLRIAPAMPGGDFAPLIADRALLAATQRRLAATGVSVFDVEIVRITPAFQLEETAGFLATCGELGARAILVAGDDADETRLADNFAAFAAAAAPYGLTADLEFMPWTTVRDCRTAHRIVEASGAPNGRVLVDSLHAARSGTTLADIRALPRGSMSYAQICDAPAEVPTTVEGLLQTARHARLLPGDGGIYLAGMFAALPGDIPVSIELPNDARKAEIGVAAWTRLALERSRALLDGVAGRLGA